MFLAKFYVIFFTVPFLAPVKTNIKTIKRFVLLMILRLFFVLDDLKRRGKGNQIFAP